MDTRQFYSLLEPSGIRSKLSGKITLTELIKGTVKLPTIIAIGALGQVFLMKVLPPRLAILPVALVSLHAIFTTALQLANGKYNTFMDNVVPGRSSAQLPYLETGKHGFEAASQPVVVFHFGVRFSHPLGLLGPGGREIGDHFQKCLEAVQRDAELYGLLGVSDWRGNEVDEKSGGERTNFAILQVYYFRDAAGLHRFAHSAIHRAAWTWTIRNAHPHIGFFHETFCVPRGAYENIYVNMPPTLFGQARVLCKSTPSSSQNTYENWDEDSSSERVQQNGDDDEPRFVGTLVSADTGRLKTMVRRLGYDSDEEMLGL